MASDLISRKALLERLEKIYGTNSIVDKIMLRFLKKLIRNQPTVDAVEVVHGEWNKMKVGLFKDAEDDTGYMCSVCGTGWWNVERWNYCPNCGAKMDGGDKK